MPHSHFRRSSRREKGRRGREACSNIGTSEARPRPLACRLNLREEEEKGGDEEEGRASSKVESRFVESFENLLPLPFLFFFHLRLFSSTPSVASVGRSSLLPLLPLPFCVRLRLLQIRGESLQALQGVETPSLSSSLFPLLPIPLLFFPLRRRCHPFDTRVQFRRRLLP